MISSSDWNLNTAATTSGTTSSGSTSGTTRTDSSSSSGIVSNPNATLDKDAFLKLLLIELQHQDPTDPMDSDKMLTQTSQLSALEMQQNTNTTMQKMVETMQKLSDSFSTSMSTSALGAIGKMATVSDNKIKLTGADELIALKMYLPEDSDENGVTLEIYDSNNKLVFSEKAMLNLFLKVYLLWSGQEEITMGFMQVMVSTLLKWFIIIKMVKKSLQITELILSKVLFLKMVLPMQKWLDKKFLLMQYKK